MTNQVSYGGTTDATQPAQAAPSTVSEPQEVKQPEYITREEAQRLVADAAEQAFRKAQSTNDRFKVKVITPFEEILKNYTSITGQQPPEQAVKALELVRSQVQELTQASAEPSSEIERKTDELYKKHGIYVEEDDPEAKGIDHTSPERFLQTLEAALVSKASRSKQPATAPVEQPANTAAMPSLGAIGVQVNPISKINDPNELLRMGLGRK